MHLFVLIIIIISYIVVSEELSSTKAELSSVLRSTQHNLRTKREKGKSTIMTLYTNNIHTTMMYTYKYNINENVHSMHDIVHA